MKIVQSGCQKFRTQLSCCWWIHLEVLPMQKEDIHQGGIVLRGISPFDQHHHPDSIYVLPWHTNQDGWIHAVRRYFSRGSTDWYNFCRDVCTTYLTRNPVRLGGPLHDDIVELNEALYKRKNKYPRGHDRGGGQWVFGIIERKNSKVMLWTHDVCGQLTLLPLWQTTATEGTGQKKTLLFKNLALMSLY